VVLITIQGMKAKWAKLDLNLQTNKKRIALYIVLLSLKKKKLEKNIVKPFTIDLPHLNKKVILSLSPPRR